VEEQGCNGASMMEADRLGLQRSGVSRRVMNSEVVCGVLGAVGDVLLRMVAELGVPMRSLVASILLGRVDVWYSDLCVKRVDVNMLSCDEVKVLCQLFNDLKNFFNNTVHSGTCHVDTNELRMLIGEIDKVKGELCVGYE